LLTTDTFKEINKLISKAVPFYRNGFYVTAPFQQHFPQGTCVIGELCILLGYSRFYTSLTLKNAYNKDQ
jgi:hypothetical protein